MILHTVNKSPFDHGALTSCLRVAAPEDTILLIEDGVYGILSAQPERELLALEDDIKTRGLSDKLPDNVKLINHSTFVELTTKASAVQSWY
ncbi:sulfurtransferase complex subunit TusB [Porticoccaceae bacterium LTM1]|nr:sulfurtransferase complex subunit TusB [Porticoccaceae bacterium LTM1]